MKFYDLEGLSERSGTDNKYEITARVSARARWLSEHNKRDRDIFANERYLSIALAEIDQGRGILAPGERVAVTPDELV
ncbi:MAG: DNA-directed RNA polymerase subunit omega [Synergistaceae bacterium]|nr:DNA-directed RNA polymerase subunit omega [Synergistaceae bacterium]MBR1603572.1 DNA-directed RNA polymerase subunit omega [Synergistaceae bacterium]